MNNFIFKMINTTKTKDGSWPGKVHALVLSKMLRVRIVIVQINYNGLKSWFDSDNWIFEEDHPGLSETMRRKAPKGQVNVTYFKQIQRFLTLCVIGRIILIALYTSKKYQRNFILMIKNRVHTREGEAQMMTVAIYFNQTCGSIY
jgi:hypothetical protein